MSEHTKGRLHQGGMDTRSSHWMRELRSEDGQGIAFCGSGSTPLAHANARRLVAAWNCCEGLTTDELENPVLKGVLTNLTIARAQRDDLLVSCKEVIEDNLHLADGDVCTLIKLKRAIQKAEGK